MNIGSVSSSNLASILGAQASSPVTGAQDSDDTGSSTAPPVHGGHHHGGGGRVGQAVAAALQSLGLSLPDAQGQDGSTTAATGADTAVNSPDPAASSSGDVRKDMHDFMHALFEAVKSEQSSGAGSNSADPSSAGSSFASGLSSLISQVSSGAAPADLQSAFGKLASDLQSASDPSASNGASGQAGDPASQATLQAFLSKLQDSLGYGATAGASATGNLLASTA